ncbi:hypothetical protein FRB94_009871 [Tulasnella sp. JGI-2019a]|nr:hypothetical protein FRB94_009871 [Tulasnella sp. JGI-2019a]
MVYTLGRGGPSRNGVEDDSMLGEHFLPEFVQRNSQLKALDLTDRSLDNGNDAPHRALKLSLLSHYAQAAVTNQDRGSGIPYMCPALSHLVLVNEMSLTLSAVRGIVSALTVKDPTQQA